MSTPPHAPERVAHDGPSGIALCPGREVLQLAAAATVALIVRARRDDAARSRLQDATGLGPRKGSLSHHAREFQKVAWRTAWHKNGPAIGEVPDTVATGRDSLDAHRFDGITGGSPGAQRSWSRRAASSHALPCAAVSAAGGARRSRASSSATAITTRQVGRELTANDIRAAVRGAAPGAECRTRPREKPRPPSIVDETTGWWRRPQSPTRRVPGPSVRSRPPGSGPTR